MNRPDDDTDGWRHWRRRDQEDTGNYGWLQNIVTTIAVARVGACPDEGRDPRISPLIERRHKECRHYILQF
jgi:hypothetical protein